MIAAMSLAGVLFAAQPPQAAGISEILANERAASISSLRYDLSFRIPEKKAEPIEGTAKIQFELRAPHDIVLDFEERPRIKAIRIGGSPAAFQFANGHIILPASTTRIGENAIEIAFAAGDESLNRNDDFLYTLFVPARAHLAFPCFDQPNLKARYSLTLEIPANWQAVANGAESSERVAPGGRRIVQFAETKPLPSYLFAFAAGKFQWKRESVTAAPSACSTAKPIELRWLATGTPCSISTPGHWRGSRNIPESLTSGASSILS